MGASDDLPLDEVRAALPEGLRALLDGLPERDAIDLGYGLILVSLLAGDSAARRRVLPRLKALAIEEVVPRGLPENRRRMLEILRLGTLKRDGLALLDRKFGKLSDEQIARTLARLEPGKPGRGKLGLFRAAAQLSTACHAFRDYSEATAARAFKQAAQEGRRKLTRTRAKK